MVDPAQRGGYTWGMKTSMPHPRRKTAERNRSLGTWSFVIGQWQVFDAIRPLRSSPSALCLALSRLASCLAATAHAQSSPALPAALERPSDARPEQRAELQRELERHAQVLEAQSAVVKIVAKLVGPAVVHIEADIPSDANRQYGNGKHGKRPARA